MKIGGEMRTQTLSITIFIASFVTLLISLKLFYNMAIFVDEYGLSPDIVSGGDFWLMTDWLRLFLLFSICLISGLSILTNNKVKK